VKLFANQHKISEDLSTEHILDKITPVPEADIYSTDIYKDCFIEC